MSPIEIGGLRPVNHDFGIVEALPTQNLAPGVTCTFKAGTGVYWRLVYTGEGEYPWAKIGGPPLRKVETTNRESGTAGGIQTTGAPSVTTPLKGEYRGRYGAATAQLASAGATQASCFLFINGAENEVTFSVGSVQFEAQVMDVGFDTKTIEAGKIVQTRYSSNNARSFTFIHLFVEIDPIRVG